MPCFASKSEALRTLSFFFGRGVARRAEARLLVARLAAGQLGQEGIGDFVLPGDPGGHVQHPRGRHPHGAGIEARLHAKDVGIALETAEAQQLRLPCLEFVASQFRAIMGQGLGTQDSSILFDMLGRLRDR